MYHRLPLGRSRLFHQPHRSRCLQASSLLPRALPALCPSSSLPSLPTAHLPLPHTPIRLPHAPHILPRAPPPTSPLVAQAKDAADARARAGEARRQAELSAQQAAESQLTAATAKAPATEEAPSLYNTFTRWFG